MIKLENTSVMNLENALRGARNPMASWERSDSFWDENHNYILGPNDLVYGRPRPPQVYQADIFKRRHYRTIILVEGI